MTETLFHAYLPLVVCTSLWLLLFRLLPETIPRFLGRGLYWVGIPLEILALARKTNFSEPAGLAPAVTFVALGLGFSVTYLYLLSWKWLQTRSLKHDQFEFLPFNWQDASFSGSFILAAVLGNTGFVGLSIAPAFIGDDYQSGGLLEVFWVFSGVLFAIGAVLEFDTSSRSRRTGRKRA